VLSVTVLIKLNIIITLPGIAKLMKKLIPQDLRPRRVNCTITPSNAPTVKVIIKLTQPLVPSEDTKLTVIGITKNNKNFAKVGVTQFAQP